MADRGKPDPQRALSRLVSSFAATGDERPAWLTPDSLPRIIDQLHRLHGQWRATPFHETLELKFP
jgi:hypothetical protein